MDYKTFLKELETIKLIFNDFYNQKIDKNVTRINNIVSEYLSDIKEGNYSIKSYKAKIIQKELENRHTVKELTNLTNTTTLQFEDLLNKYFVDFKQSLEKEVYSFSKIKDIKDKSNQLKRDRQNLLNIKNNLFKDIQLKNKEFENIGLEKDRIYTENVLDVRNKLALDLFKEQDATLKNYSEFELTLLNTDEVKEIKELKKKINEVRKKGISEEFFLKKESYLKLLQLDKEIIIDSTTHLCDTSLYNLEQNKKLIEIDYKIENINLDLDNIENSYDSFHEKKDLEKFLEDVDFYLNLLNNLNLFLEDKNPFDKMIIFDFAKLNIYQILIYFKSKYTYSSLNIILKNILSKVDSYIEEISKINDVYKASSKVKKVLLLEALKDYYIDPKKGSKLEFIENIILTLQRYYDNLHEELELFNKTFYNIICILTDLLIKHVNEVLDNLVPKIESKYLINNFNYDYVFIWNKTDAINFYEYYPKELKKLELIIKNPLYDKINNLNREINRIKYKYTKDKNCLLKNHEKETINNLKAIKKTKRKYTNDRINKLKHAENSTHKMIRDSKSHLDEALKTLSI